MGLKWKTFLILCEEAGRTTQTEADRNSCSDPNVKERNKARNKEEMKEEEIN
jgi:hypothetical protein